MRIHSAGIETKVPTGEQELRTVNMVLRLGEPAIPDAHYLRQVYATAYIQVLRHNFSSLWSELVRHHNCGLDSMGCLTPHTKALFLQCIGELDGDGAILMELLQYTFMQGFPEHLRDAPDWQKWLVKMHSLREILSTKVDGMRRKVVENQALRSMLADTEERIIFQNALDEYLSTLEALRHLQLALVDLQKTEEVGRRGNVA